MNTGIDISVIVCTYNRAALLYRAVESLFHLNTANAFVHEIVVIDDASTDDTPAILKGLQARTTAPLRVARATGAGIAAARNCGVLEAKGDFVAFFDDDQLADPNWLLELWQTRLATGAACVGGARVLDLPAHERAAMPSIIRLYLGEIPIEKAPRPCGRADLLCTGTVLIERPVFARVGGFDESLTEGGEDTEFFMRVRAAGLQTWYTPRSLARHIIPSYRREAPYLIWTAMRGGACFACRDLREWGRARTIAAALLRMTHAIAVHAPLFVAARLRGSKAHTLARRCQIYRALAYTRSALSSATPTAPREGARAAMAFRRERSLFPETGPRG
ncbi:MAG: glycosyltransferase family A protein [Candidatus Hydrogenedentales bacterium]